MEKRERIQNVLNYIETNLFSEISNKLLVDIAYMSTFHFQRVFQSLVGDPISTYIRNRRLSEAALLLISSDIKIIDIALDCQFGSHEAFIHSFKSYFNTSPNIFRKSKPIFTTYSKVSLEDKRDGIEEFNLHKPREVLLEASVLYGIEKKTNISDFSISKEIIKLGKTLLDKIGNKSDLFCICNELENEKHSIFVGIKEPKTDYIGLVKREIKTGKYLEFTYSGAPRRIFESNQFLKENYNVTEFINIYPVLDTSIANYSSAILIPI